MINKLQDLESKQRGSLEFPLEYHYVSAYHPRYAMPYHWHNEFEMIYVLSGVFVLTLDGTTYSLAPGDVAFVSPGSLHGGDPKNCVYECVVFDLRSLLRSNDHCRHFITDIASRQITVQPHFPRHHKVIKHTIPPMFDALRQECPGYALITLGCLFQFIGEVYKHGTYADSRDEQNWRTEKLLKLKHVFEKIENEYASPLTLADLAASVHMTTKYFCRFFKEATYRTPMEYLGYYRIERATYDLASTDKSITEIALDAGFSSTNYFIRSFKKYKGITPGAFLKQTRAS